MSDILEKKGLPIATEYVDKQTKKKHVFEEGLFTFVVFNPPLMFWL